MTSLVIHEIPSWLMELAAHLCHCAAQSHILSPCCCSRQHSGEYGESIARTGQLRDSLKHSPTGVADQGAMYGRLLCPHGVIGKRGPLGCGWWAAVRARDLSGWSGVMAMTAWSRMLCSAGTLRAMFRSRRWLGLFGA
ncbi:hypothetical protein BU26DRAFT_55317 [Trematosphaeria pertusa]|uniref:Uncharacterized protein n=1 Tax=Trematosphaeria pertusa TaxID=390896 RepID=A0A6A6IBH9_9PLEO|nr:uncharacterized protein BU26DRAFT_55317 [Trematosphaeria pertusa]KAF2246900.1 hypothetical protein BU26DRAFT_55317 [Trematosphaeria pertusa]